MTETAQLPASQQASVAPEQGTQKRAIQMKMFSTPKIKSKVAYDFEQTNDIVKSSAAVGQIVGQIFAVSERKFTLQDGSASTALMAVGDFEGVVYETGEVITSGSAYLPRYYLETVDAILKANVNAAPVVDFALEIVIVPTGKNIPIAYEVRNLISRRPENRLNQIKLELARHGRLRLPAPVVADRQAIEGEVVHLAHGESASDPTPDASAEPATGDEPDLPGAEPAEVEAAKAKAGKKETAVA